MIHPALGKGRLGTRVRVRDLDSVAVELRGLSGRITQCFGHPDHAAYEVLLDGGISSPLFWYYQLEDGTPDRVTREPRRPPLKDMSIRVGPDSR